MAEYSQTIEQLINQLETDGIELSDDLIEKINNGDGKSLCCIGLIYLSKKNYKNAIPWQRLSASKNFAKGQLCLGMAYKKGQGVPIDYHVSMEWFLKAAYQNDLDAIYHAGLLLEQGLGVPTNKKMALELYYKVSTSSDDIDRLNDQGYYITRQDTVKSTTDLIRETEEILKLEKEKTATINKFKNIIVEEQKMKNEIDLLQENNKLIGNELRSMKEKMLILENKHSNLCDLSDQSNKMIELLCQANEKLVNLSEKEKRENDKRIRSLKKENKEIRQKMQLMEKTLQQSNT